MLVRVRSIQLCGLVLANPSLSPTSLSLGSFRKDFGMESYKAVATPLAERLTLRKDDCPVVGSDKETLMKHLDCRGQVGSVFYLAQTTRHELAFSAHLLPRFLNNPVQAHWQAAKHVLQPQSY